MNIVVRRNVASDTSLILFFIIENHELRHHDPKKVIIIPDLSIEQWKKDIEKAPKAFCVNYEVVNINENSLLLKTPSNAPAENIAKMMQEWFDKKYAPIGM